MEKRTQERGNVNASAMQCKRVEQWACGSVQCAQRQLLLPPALRISNVNIDIPGGGGDTHLTGRARAQVKVNLRYLAATHRAAACRTGRCSDVVRMKEEEALHLCEGVKKRSQNCRSCVVQERPGKANLAARCSGCRDDLRPPAQRKRSSGPAKMTSGQADASIASPSSNNTSAPPHLQPPTKTQSKICSRFFFSLRWVGSGGLEIPGDLHPELNTQAQLCSGTKDDAGPMPSTTRVDIIRHVDVNVATRRRRPHPLPPR
ncbi:hypothetical protein FN846DRAFT_259711 [Sphaerosporella brunnea]|uniref:Uncharacterized protein n=1 Tax=Sphaerosporella brunnea TaxID=1250544 RepID=A0A5J5F6X3_9PEZI|nr:hypothetical protein FN846DRAFT_259711 [Sphaerosporella brunnea]